MLTAQAALYCVSNTPLRFSLFHGLKSILSAYGACFSQPMGLKRAHSVLKLKSLLKTDELKFGEGTGRSAQ